MLTNKQLSEIERRCNAAPEGPWMVELTDIDHFFVVKHIETAPVIDRKFYPAEVAKRTAEFDVLDEHGYVRFNPEMFCDLTDGQIGKLEFIAHAREDMPKLIAEVKELRAKLGITN